MAGTEDLWVLQWTLIGRYFTASGQWYCSLNGVCYSEHYVEGTSQQVDSGIAAWMECVTVNINWKVLHSRWTVVSQLEWSVLQWNLFWNFGPWRQEKYEKCRFLFFILHWTISRCLNSTKHTFDCTTSPVAKQTQLSIPLFNIQHLFPYI